MSSYLLRFPFLCLIVAREKIILSSKALPVLYSDVWGHFLNDHHSWSLPVCLIMLCTVDTPKSISCTVYQGIFKVHVHSDQQKSIGVIFRTSRSGSDVRYSCHHNSSHFSFPIFAHSWRFSVFHSLQSITPRIY